MQRPAQGPFSETPPCCGGSRRWPASLMSEGERRTVPGQGQRFHARSVRQRGKDLPTLGRGLLWSSMVAVPVDWRRTSGIRPHPTDLPSQLVDIDAQPNQRQTGPGTARSAENPRQSAVVPRPRRKAECQDLCGSVRHAVCRSAQLNGEPPGRPPPPFSSTSSGSGKRRNCRR